MEISISKLLGEGTLPQELVQTLQEAFDKKIENVRNDLQVSIREEFAKRYEHDKDNLVEAMNTMLSEVAKKHEEDKTKSINEFVEARNAFRTARKSLNEKFKIKLEENTKVSKELVFKKLSEEVVKLRKEKKKLVDAKLCASDELEEAKKEMQDDMKKRIKKIDEFVIRQMQKELSELNEDHKALIETRVKLVTESRDKLRETTSNFVKEAAKKVESVINSTLRNEMTQLHEDLERNRQNMFGRRIFEAVAAEFLTSHLNEGSEINKLQTVLESREVELQSMKEKLDEAVKVSQQSLRKIKIAEERAIRGKILNELLTNIKGEKRTVMEGMLDTVKTESLRETFNRLLPVVLNEKVKPTAPTVKKLVENTSVNNSNIVTGNRNNILTEDTQKTINDDTADIIRLAGIYK
jgi:hypothetical protein